MPARLLRLRILTTLHRALLDMPLSDDIQWDWGDWSRLALDDPPIGQELFEEGVPKPAICSNSPSWDSHYLRPWASDIYYWNFEPETSYSAGVGNFGPLELIHLTASNESWNVQFPFEAGSDVPTGIVHEDADIGDPFLGEPFHEQQNQEMLNLGTQFPL